MPEGHEHVKDHHPGDDESLLAKLGYKQDLDRSWSGFSNFAISFSIISILAGCFTNFGAGWNNGGPISISWSWPILSLFILLIGFTMSELVSAYPTSGGIYWWASKLGGPRAGFYTGWLNLVGLVAVTAGVSYGCATFIDLTISTASTSFAEDYSLTRVFLIFVAVLALAAVLNIFRGHLMAVMNNVSVWWHVAGASAIVLILIFVPDQHQSFSYVFTERFNNSGFSEGSTTSFAFFFAIIPFGFLLTQYTITGFDACAHLSEETKEASMGAAKGIWQSIFYSALGGYILLLCVVFAVPNVDGAPDNAGVGAGGVAYIFTSSLGTDWASVVLFISAAGQTFCAVSCMTSASRMLFAFSRDRAVPGSSRWSSLTANRVPANAVLLVAVASAIVTLPALIEVNLGTEAEPLIVPVAFYAVTSVAVQGLYLSFAIPIFLRWRHGDRFEVGAWNNGSKYKWMNLIAVAEIIIVSVYLMMPFVPGAVPGNENFEWKFVNYAPIVTLGVLLLITVWWEASAKNWFKGPIRTIDTGADVAPIPLSVVARALERVSPGTPADRLSEVVLRPVRGHHAFEGCVEQLATAIRLGVYPPGSGLPPERDLAERMGVSRATLREAIAALRQAGMVRTIRGRGGGTVVAYQPVTPQHPRTDDTPTPDRRARLLDCLVFRRVVEPGAAWTAATQTLSTSQEHLLTTALSDVDQAGVDGDVAAHRQADSRLHLAIASVTGSPRTVEAVTDVQGCLHQMLVSIPVLAANLEHSSNQHRAIVGAVLTGSPATARRAMERHCDDTAALLRGLLE